MRLDVFLLVLNATKKPWNLKFQGFLINWWDNRDRTDDLLNAIQALSQLSYIPIKDSDMIKFDYVAVNTILLCVCYPIKY